jgi:hypothetical protein
VQSLPAMGINEWLAEIEKRNLKEHERLILECANHYDKITVNHNARFNYPKILTI